MPYEIHRELALIPVQTFIGTTGSAAPASLIGLHEWPGTAIMPNDGAGGGTRRLSLFRIRGQH